MDSLKNKILSLYNQAKSQLVIFFGSLKRKLNFKSTNYSSHTELDKKLIYSLSKSKIPSLRQIKYIKKFLSPIELWVVRISFIVIILSLILLGRQFYKNNLVVVPALGGMYTEGVVGTPKYVNPLYSIANDADSDLETLIFSSLFKRGKDGEITNDLARSYEISEDNKVYTVKIRTDAKWQGNLGNVTVNDIVFTFNAIKDSQYKSPWRPTFSGVDIEKVDEETLKFNLSEPYAPFLGLLTFGIMPQELWSQIQPETARLAELNLKPVGSGPYKFEKYVKDRAGNIKSFSLSLNEVYYGQKPNIESIVFKYYASNEESIDALNNNDVDGISYLPSNLKEKIISQDSLNFHNLNSTRLTAIFFNLKGNSNLQDKKIRQALAEALNKSEMVSQIFSSNAHVIDGPILPSNFAYKNDIKKYKFDQEEAKKVFTNAKWLQAEITEADLAKAQEDLKSEDSALKKEAETKTKMGVGNWLYKEASDKTKNYFVITLTTVDNENYIKMAEAIKKYWEILGVKTEINVLSANQLPLEVIKPRNFEVLLYGQALGIDPDCYAFWHSSQISESGLNISNFSNKEADQLLEEARVALKQEDRIEKYKKFQEIIAEEVPAIFLYSSNYIYVQGKTVYGFDMRNILIPSDRFNDIFEWYIKTSKKLVW
ncbi:MAG: ABC transporter substrate-binding protein [Patescibacteria group bacterium]|nr:ABC transporter substrate-binding protein [Patescibacteria group bacterium]MDD4610667.1 ABC transporter substrate-binding protein [Patescibacteria group bacterium]